MSRQEIDLGLSPEESPSGQGGEGGDSARRAFTRVNEMTTELYAADAALESRTEALVVATENLAGRTDDLESQTTDLAALKVDKVPGKGLSTNDFTDALYEKLSTIEGSKFQGLFVSLEALQLAIPVGAPGWYAHIDPGAGGEDTALAIWDEDDAAWILHAAGGEMTPAQILAGLLANPDVNVLSDGEYDKLAGVQAEATKNLPDAQLLSRSNHTGTQQASTISDLAEAVRAVVIAGLSPSSSDPVISTDSILAALGKLQQRSEFGLPRPGATDSATDFNSLVTGGWQPKLYGAAAGSRNANHPDGQASGAADSGVTNYYYLLVLAYGTDNRMQIAFPHLSAADTTAATIKYRWRYTANDWTAWFAVPRAGSGGGAIYLSEYLIVGGGGAGGGATTASYGGGGGGGGGVRYGSQVVGAGYTYPVVVGAGGASVLGSVGGDGGKGGDSSVFGITANGGGGGGGYPGTGGAVKNGASGGGGTSYVAAAGTGIAGQGSNGGTGAAGAGGGGGASSVGGNGSGGSAGPGGAGLSSSISGVAVTYGGGGGGGGGYSAVPSGGGGAGGGGAGGGGSGNTANGASGQAGAANTGGGGGGQNGGTGSGSATSGAGGSGVVIVRYPGTPKATGGTITQSGGFTIHTFTASGNLVFS